MKKIHDFLNEIDFFISTIESNKKSKTSLKIAGEFREFVTNNKEWLIDIGTIYEKNETNIHPDFNSLKNKYENVLNKLKDADDQISQLLQDKQMSNLNIEIAHTSIKKLENSLIVNKNIVDELERLLHKSQEENNEKNIIIEELRSEKKPNELIKKIENDNTNLKIKCNEYEKLFNDYQNYISNLESKINSISPPHHTNYIVDNPLHFDSSSNKILTLHEEIMMINKEEEYNQMKKEYKDLCNNNRSLMIQASNLRDELERQNVMNKNKNNDDMCCCLSINSCIIS